jgi:hypothetical protein
VRDRKRNVAWIDTNSGNRGATEQLVHSFSIRSTCDHFKDAVARGLAFVGTERCLGFVLFTFFAFTTVIRCMEGTDGDRPRALLALHKSMLSLVMSVSCQSA